MKTSKIFGILCVAMIFVMTGCRGGFEVDKESLKPVLGEWFYFSQETDSRIFMEFLEDGNFVIMGSDKEKLFGKLSLNDRGSFSIRDNELKMLFYSSNLPELVLLFEATEDKLTLTIDELSCTFSRVKEDFDSSGNYYLDRTTTIHKHSVGIESLNLPEGITYRGGRVIPLDSVLKSFEQEIDELFWNKTVTFTAEDFTLDKNDLIVNLNVENDVYNRLNAICFPDESGDNLFVIIKKQPAIIGGMLDILEKENGALDAVQQEALATEFMEVFDSFVSLLSFVKE